MNVNDFDGQIVRIKGDILMSGVSWNYGLSPVEKVLVEKVFVIGRIIKIAGARRALLVDAIEVHRQSNGQPVPSSQWESPDGTWRLNLAKSISNSFLGNKRHIHVRYESIKVLRGKEALAYKI